MIRKGINKRKAGFVLWRSTLAPLHHLENDIDKWRGAPVKRGCFFASEWLGDCRAGHDENENGSFHRDLGGCDGSTIPRIVAKLKRIPDVAVDAARLAMEEGAQEIVEAMRAAAQRVRQASCAIASAGLGAICPPARL